MRRLPFILLALALGCSNEPPSADDTSDDHADDDDTSDDGSDDGMGEDSGDSGTTGVDPCRELQPPGTAAEGEACTADTDCASLVCSHRSTLDSPIDATCLEPPVDCTTRVRGTVRDLISLLALPNVEVTVLGATDAANDPTQAVPLAMATSDSRGWFDVETEAQITAPYALVGRSEGGGFARTLTGLDVPDANGDYAPILGVREWWVLTTSDLGRWDEALADEPAAQPYLPLASGRAVFGIVRTEETPSTPIQGATVVPQLGTASAAEVLYLRDNRNAFGGTTTSGNGVFLILGAAAGETFDVAAPGRVTHASRVAGFPQATFITDARLQVQ